MTQKKIVTAFDLEFDDANLQKFYGQTMMSIKDLMFGDWVDAEGYGRVKGIIIDEEDYCPQVLIRDDVWYPLNLIEPIPLTPEILEKNGLLDPAHSEYYVRYDRHDEEWYFIYYGSFAEVKVSITAVHELQHCLKLVGISKEIEL